MPPTAHSNQIYKYIGILLGARPILHISRIKVNVWRKIVEYLNVHIVYSPLVYSKISYGMTKITELSCSMIL
jgi:hypothetical protein